MSCTNYSTPSVLTEYGCIEQKETKCCLKTDPNGYYNSSFLWGIMALILITIVVWFVLNVIKPEFVQNIDLTTTNTNGTINQGKAILWSILLALLIVVVGWILLALSNYSY